MSLSLWTVDGSGIRPKQSPGATARQRRERMHPLSTDGWALRLHSCRALSSQPQTHPTPNRQNLATFPLTTHIPVSGERAVWVWRRSGGDAEAYNGGAQLWPQCIPGE